MIKKRDKIVLHPTDLAQWQALVMEAERLRAHELGEDLESYLVFLLMRYTTQSELANSILALDFLDALELTGQVGDDLLRDVGDKCLLFSGLFPGLAAKRCVDLNYFIDMGQSAYGTLSASTGTGMAELFQTLSEQFVSVMNVLQATRDVSQQSLLSQKVLFINAANEPCVENIITARKIH